MLIFVVLIFFQVIVVGSFNIVESDFRIMIIELKYVV